jgi:hypothetical protein
MIILRRDFNDRRCTASAGNECLGVRLHNCSINKCMTFEDLKIAGTCLSNYNDEQNAVCCVPRGFSVMSDLVFTASLLFLASSVMLLLNAHYA